MEDFIKFYIRQGYSEDEAKALYNEYLRKNSVTVSSARPEWEHNPHIISAEQKRLLDRFLENKNRQADAMTFGMTPHKNLIAANVGAEDIANNVAGTIALEGLNAGIVLPVLRALGHTNLGRSIALSRQLNKGIKLYDKFNARPKPKISVELGLERIPEELKLSNIIPEEGSKLDKHFKDTKFTPLLRVLPSSKHKQHAEEIILRLRDLGYDMDSEFRVGNSRVGIKLTTPAQYIRDKVNNPIYAGYFGDLESVGNKLGVYLSDISVPAFDVRSPDLFTTALHEAIMHKTDGFIEGLSGANLNGKTIDTALKLYKDFLENLTKDAPIIRLNISPTKLFTAVVSPEGELKMITDGSLRWQELRATIGELVSKYMRAFLGASGLDPNVSGFRESFRKYIDDLTEETLIQDLGKLNAYGRSYVNLRHSHPLFINDLKHLIKYAPSVTLPAVVYDKQTNESQ